MLDQCRRRPIVLCLLPWLFSFLQCCLSLCSTCCFAQQPLDKDYDKDDHPDPNEEEYEGMIYIGRYHSDGRRVGFEQDNGVKFIFGTSFDESHKTIEEKDLLAHSHERHHYHDLADRNHPTKTREQVLQERRHKPVSELGPKPFGHVGT